VAKVKTHWLMGHEDRVLRTRVLLGDEVAIGNDARWYAPAGSAPISGGVHVLMLSYDNDEDTIRFCLPVPPCAGMDDVRALRKLVAPERAEQVWGPFVSRIGHRSSLGNCPQEWVEAKVGSSLGLVRVRRRLYQNFLIDILMLREREAAVGRLWPSQEISPGSARVD